MKLFTVGPVEMGEEIRIKGGEPIPYFRTSEFSEVMLDIEKKYLELLDASVGSKLITLTASGTGGMEAAVCNLFDKNDKLLVINGGSFGHRFVELCECFEIPHEVLEVPFESDLTEDMLDVFSDKGFTGLLVNIDETSIGKLYDYKMIGDFCKRNNMIYVVDAISSFLADELSMTKGNIDAVIMSSQKALALPPGLSYVALNSKMVERLNTIKPRTMYFDFKDYLKNMERGQTPFTPAVGIILQTKLRIDEAYAAGIEKMISHHAELANYFRDLCETNGIKVATFNKSNAVTAILLDGKATEVFETLKNEYDIMLTPSGGAMKDEILRVGHLGDLTKADYDNVVSLIKKVLGE